MSFRIRDFEAILFAGLVFSILPLAKAQSTGGDHILFSSPQGKASSAPLPMVQAPQPKEQEGPPAGQMNVNIFNEPAQEEMFPSAPPAQLPDNGQKQDEFSDPMGLRKELGVPTPEQMMNLPTAEQMFGLPERNAPEPLTRRSGWTTGDTNGLSPGTTDDSTWVNVWSRNIGNINSNGTERASGPFSGFFDSTRNQSLFGNRDWGSTETSFGTPQTGGQQRSSWDAALMSAATPPAPAGDPAQINFSSPKGASSDGFSSQSPFLPPQVSSVSSLKTLPQLPTLPALPGGKEVDTQPPSVPSWAPKPPPWTQSRTPFGTAVQLKAQN